MSLRSDPEAMRRYKREWYAKRRAAYFADKSCVCTSTVCGHGSVCGSTEKLELDHVDRSTKVSNSIWSWSEARRNEELAKCQVLCEFCHQTKSAEERGWKRGEHGSVAMYGYYGCRCRLCATSQAARCKEWRARTHYSKTAARRLAA